MAKSFEHDGKTIEIPDALFVKIEGEIRSKMRDEFKSIQTEFLTALGQQGAQGSVKELAEKITKEISAMQDRLKQVEQSKPVDKPIDKPGDTVSKAELENLIARAVADKEKALLTDFQSKSKQSQIESIINDVRATAIANGLKPNYQDLVKRIISDNFEIETDNDKRYFYTKGEKKTLLSSVEEVNKNLKESYPEMFEQPRRGFPAPNEKTISGQNGSRYNTEKWGDKTADQLMAEGIEEELTAFK